MDPIPDSLEFAVSQDVDGVLSTLDRRTLGDRLSGDAARNWADEDRRMNALLRGHDPLPEIDFGAFAASVSAAVADEPNYAPARLTLPGVWWRRMSIAAGLALAATLGLHFLSGSPQTITPVPPAGMAMVSVPATMPTGGTITVAVGPSEELKEQGLAMGLGTVAIANQKPRVIISSVDLPAGDLRPY